MTRRDLRTLFRSNSPDLSAEEVFSDREDEWEAIARSVTACVAGMSDPGFDVEDFEEPRRNVLMFYGVGGIGKTSLSHNAAEKLAGGEGGPNHWPPLLDLPARLLPVRIDLSRQAGTDFETLMLALRLTVARLGRPMPAFDLALRRWWEANHPGQTLDEYLHGSRFLGRLSDSMSLSAQMESALADLAQAFLLPGTVGNVVGRGLRTIVRALREHRQQVRALARCRRLPDLLEAEPDLETLSYYAHLLAWDLAQLPAEQAALPVVLLDTFEDVGSRAHRELERLIQRVVWLMPNALFVITGRNRLQWDEGRLEGQLDWTGPRAWPFLVPGATQDPRQHRVGYLSAQDCDEYLCRRLTQDGEPLMGHSTRQQVISHSRGLPLYLDLAVMRFLDLYQQRDRHPSPEEFNLDFPALVARTFRDLSSEERQLLRGVSLLDSFSVELATAVAGYDRDTPALHLVERPFIDQDPSAPWPYHLHDLLRDAIRDTDADSEDRWSAADWRRAAQRAFDALGRELARAEPCGDRKVLMACLRQGLRLARDFRLDPDWLTAAAFSYIEDSVWEPIDLDFNPTRIGSPPEALAVVLHTVASRQHVHRQRTAEVLETVIESGLLPAAADELARYHLAECARDLGHLDASAAGMRHVVQANARLAGRAARGLAHLSRRLGRFPDVLDAANRLGPDGRKQRVLGDLWWTQGDIAASCAAYAAGRDEAEEQRLYGEAALSQACLAFAAAFQDRQRAQEQIDRARSMLGQADIRWATVQVSIAELLRDAGNDGDVQDRAEAVVREAEVGGLSSSIAYARFALCFHAVITGEVSLIATARSQLQRCVRGAEFAYLLELSYFMTGSEPPITCIGPSGSMAGNEPLTDGQDLSSDAVGISLRRGDNAVMASYTTLADVDQPLIAGRYGLDELHLAPLEGGMANSSFLATAAQGKYVLTVLDNHDLAGAERLAGLNTELWRRSVPTSEVVPSLAGTRVTDMHGRPTVLKRWLPGRTLEELPVALLRPAGRLLAQLHRTRSDGLRLPIGTRRLSDAHLRAIDTFPDQDFAQWLRRHLKRSPRMDGTRRRHCFVHGDFHADNIVVRPDGSLAILDWETATVDDPLLDIGMALVGHARVGEALSQERAGEFIVGYREAGDLEDGDLRQLPRAVQHAALIIAFHRYHRHNVRFPDMAKAQMFREMMDIADVAEQLSFTV